MVNTDDFIKRLEFLLDNYNLNASAFADKIGVQRSSISHLLSGRNKPSLDFVLKIQEFFPEVNLYWILNGKERFLKSEQKEIQNAPVKIVATPTLFEDLKTVKSEYQIVEKVDEFIANKNNPDLSLSLQNNKSDATIFKIVIFYHDGTFKDFNQGL